VGRSWDRGCNGHRILGRVLTDGRHPGSSRSVGFHETASTVSLAGSVFLRPASQDQKSSEAAKWQHPRRRMRREEAEFATGMSEARSPQRRGKKTPTLASPGREAVEREKIVCCIAIRRSVLECRETLGSSVMLHGAQDSGGRPRRESGESELRTREVRVHVVRMGGRYRSVASRAFSTVRSQDRVVVRGR
jgi:hypothetical protein